MHEWQSPVCDGLGVRQITYKGEYYCLRERGVAPVNGMLGSKQWFT